MSLGGAGSRDESVDVLAAFSFIGISILKVERVFAFGAGRWRTSLPTEIVAQPLPKPWIAKIGAENDWMAIFRTV
jgi:hypothetical protein